MIGNCCITNQFESTTCFGEALLREPNKGAQGYIGSTQLNFNDETLVKFKFENPIIQSVQISVGKINFLNKETEYGDFLDIQIPGYHSSKKNGYPKLPQINRLIEIPQKASISTYRNFKLQFN